MRQSGCREEGPPLLKTIKRGLDLALESGLWLAMLVEVLTVIWQVFTRFVLRNPSSWTEELAIFLLIWIGLLGSAVALHRRAHLGLDFLVARLPERAARLTTIFAALCVVAFAGGVLLVGGSGLVRTILMNRQISPALGWPMGYVYLALPISGFFLTLYALEFIWEEIQALRGRRVAPQQPAPTEELLGRYE